MRGFETQHCHLLWLSFLQYFTVVVQNLVKAMILKNELFKVLLSLSVNATLVSGS